MRRLGFYYTSQQKKKENENNLELGGYWLKPGQEYVHLPVEDSLRLLFMSECSQKPELSVSLDGRKFVATDYQWFSAVPIHRIVLNGKSVQRFPFIRVKHCHKEWTFKIKWYK